MSQEKIAEILATFERYSRVYERQAIEEAVACQAEITPHLIDILEQIIADPEKYSADNEYFGHIYAFILLGYFKEKQAHETIVRLFSLPGKITNRLFADQVTEDLPIILTRTYHGSPEAIKSLILKREAYEFARGSAMGALSYLVAEGQLERESIIAFFSTLFTGDEAEPDSYFWSSVVLELINLYAVDTLPLIEQAFEAVLIDTFFVGLDDAKEALAPGKVDPLASLREEVARKSMDDIHDYMSWWACFQPKPQPPPIGQSHIPAFQPMSRPISPPAQSELPKVSNQIQQRAKKKKKRKMAKASRKKNRRR